MVRFLRSAVIFFTLVICVSARYFTNFKFLGVKADEDRVLHQAHPHPTVPGAVKPYQPHMRILLKQPYFGISQFNNVKNSMADKRLVY
ncbi:hypothetical protein L596_019189 [Steinernema carpocapsae]|uniref:Uncharacterized protein n=1 Tax=Steinernema carpocapsae TaxID=34508 RepID=A0A4U5MPL7_STECR|nr:hypothetical protein L596_019189 [Steinernema carpocapsae]